MTFTRGEAGLVDEVVKRKNRRWEGKSTNRPLSKDYERVGFAGEWEFGKWARIMPNLTAGGDGGFDFLVPIRLKVDVKTSKKGDELLVEVGKVRADIYVLAKYEEEMTWVTDKEQELQPKVTLLGWAWSAEVLAKSPVTTHRGIVSHVVSVSELHPMVLMRQMVGVGGV